MEDQKEWGKSWVVESGKSGEENCNSISTTGEVSNKRLVYGLLSSCLP